VNHERTTLDGETVSAALDGGTVLLTREVELSPRTPSGAPKADKKHPPRDERTATLDVSAATLDIRRPKHIKADPMSLRLNIVQVRERNPPPDEPAVEWRLITNLPIETADDVAAVVDIYRARWLIEEYFKALKTGCSFLKRQAESRTVLERILAIYAAAAWRLLLIRWLSRSAPDLPAETVVTPTQLACLRHAAIRKPLSNRPTVREAALAIAALGGHLPHNGDPGWQTLGRGFERLTDMEIAWVAARTSADPAGSHTM
jgi:hypothetical protein